MLNKKSRRPSGMVFCKFTYTETGWFLTASNGMTCTHVLRLETSQLSEVSPPLLTFCVQWGTESHPLSILPQSQVNDISSPLSLSALHGPLPDHSNLVLPRLSIFLLFLFLFPIQCLPSGSMNYLFEKMNLIMSLFCQPSLRVPYICKNFFL